MFDNGIFLFIMGSWALLCMSCFFIAGLKLYKFLKNKKTKKPHLTLIQGGKKDGPYGNLSNKK